MKNSMLNCPPVSVIVPVYNSAAFLYEAIESIIVQDALPQMCRMEIIVVDDGSTDTSNQVVQTFVETSPVPVRYVYQENSGPAAARNHGLRLAQGDLIAFQDADDVWTPDKLSAQVGYLQDHPSVQYALCRVRHFLHPGCLLPAGFRHEWFNQEPAAYLIQAMVARRALFDLIGPFDSTLRLAEDVDWFARALDADIPGYVIPRVLLHKRVHEANISLTTLNNQLLLTALRRSVRRKRTDRNLEDVS